MSVNAVTDVERQSNLWRDFAKLKLLWPYFKGHKGLIVFSALMIPLVALANSGYAYILKYIVDEGILKKEVEILYIGCGFYLIAVLVSYVTRTAQYIASGIAVQHMVRYLRRTLAKHVLNLSPRFHDKNMSGAIVTRATSDFDNLNESLVQGILTSVADIAIIVGQVAGMFYLNYRFGIIAIISIVIVSLIVNVVTKQLKKALLLNRKAVATLNAYAQEGMYNHTTVKLLKAEDKVSGKFRVLSEVAKNARLKSVYFDSALYSIIEGVTTIIVGISIWMCLSYFEIGDALTAGAMVAFIQYLRKLFEPLKKLGENMAMLQSVFTAIERIFGVLQTKDFVEGEKDLKNLEGTILFQNVSFSYGEETVLKNLSFQVPQGTSLALVGKTGSGKTTIMKLITKMYGNYEGSIQIDNRYEIKDLDGKKLREKMAIVPQDVVIFAGTLEFNITLGAKGFSEADIKKACEIVGAWKFIRELPNGLQTEIHEQGGNLSHGQRQLIVFARAILRDPKVIILDEATSSVDAESEAIIQKGLERMISGRTVLIVAHRLSTIERCDSILVLDKGTVLEKGSHDTLLQQKGHYWQLHGAKS